MQTLLGGPRAGLDEETVLEVLSLARGARTRFGVDLLDTDDVDAGVTVDVDTGEVAWSYRPPDRLDGLTNEAAEVRRTATLNIGPTDLPVETYRYRIWREMQALDGTWVRFNRGVFVSTNPPIDDDGIVVRRSLRLAEKTYRYRQRELVDTLVVPAGTNPVTFLADRLLTLFGDVAVFPASTLTLTTDMVFHAGDNELAVGNALLESAALDQLTCDEDTGRPRSVVLSELAARGPEWSYGPGISGDRVGKIVTKGAVEPLIDSLPNVVRFIARQGPSLAEEDNGIKTKRNETTGPASLLQRGETIEKRVVVDAEGQDELDAIADADAQRWFAGGGLRFTGQIGLNPLHGERDVVSLYKPRLGLTGDWLVTGWREPLQKVSGADAVLMSMVMEKRV